MSSRSKGWLATGYGTAIVVNAAARADMPGRLPDGPDRTAAGWSAWMSGPGQRADGGSRVHFYRKWTGAHWRLVSLVELGVPVRESRATAAAKSVIDHFAASRRRVTVVGGLPRRCASVEGNALAVCSRLGLADDHRVRDLADAIISWQRPDGGPHTPEVVDWGRSGPNEMITLNALRVLRATGRLS